jgi:hypothetical protein
MGTKAMWRGLLKELDAASQVEHEASDLRQTHGPLAESWCDSMVAILPARDERRAHVRDLRRALKWVGHEGGAHHA